MEQLAIKGHETRGKEVIEILEMLGGKISHECGYEDGFDSHYVYFIDSNENYYIDGLLIGDKNPTNLSIFTLEEFLEKFPYKVGDRVKNARINDFIGRITNVRWDENEKQIIYVVEWNDIAKSTLTYFARGLQPYKEETTEEIKVNIPKGYEFARIDDNQQVVFTRIHAEYPKTYKECCKIMKIHSSYELFGQATTQGEITDCAYAQSLLKKINKFQQLIICRDAYWKLAGEQMGLGKPWKPDFKDDSDKYFICYVKDEVWMSNIRDCNKVLVFPTEEIRDLFYQNFKNWIEIVKELI